MISNYIHKKISFAGIPFNPTISWIISHKDIYVFIQKVYPLISLYIFPNCYPWKILWNISNFDIPEYIQITYPRPISKISFYYLFIHILSYPSDLSWKCIHMYTQPWYPRIYPLHISMPNILIISYSLSYFMLLYIGSAGVLHDEIILTVTSSFSMLRSAAPVPWRMLQPLCV